MDAIERRLRNEVEAQMRDAYGNRPGPRRDAKLLARIWATIIRNDMSEYKPLSTERIIQLLPDIEKHRLVDNLAFLRKFPEATPFLKSQRVPRVLNENGEEVKRLRGAPSVVYMVNPEWLEDTHITPNQMKTTLAKEGNEIEEDEDGL